MSLLVQEVRLSTLKDFITFKYLWLQNKYLKNAKYLITLRILKPETSVVQATFKVCQLCYLFQCVFGGSSLHSLIFPYPLAKYEELYAFSYNPKQNESEQVKGWQLIDLAEEYKRMGVPNDYWQLSDANRDYKVRTVVEKCFTLFLLYPLALGL